jgi:hypothetical protein
LWGNRLTESFWSQNRTRFFSYRRRGIQILRRRKREQKIMGGKKSRLSKFTEAVRLLFTRFCASFFTLSFSLSFSGVAANSLSLNLSL